jgi:subtilisin family serine protease
LAAEFLCSGNLLWLANVCRGADQIDPKDIQVSVKAKTIVELVGAVVLAVSLAPLALAGSYDDQATITVVDEGGKSDDVVKVIELPSHASAAATKKSSLTTANSGKDRPDKSNQNAGQQISDDSRTANISDQARADAVHQARSDNAAGNHHAPTH